MDIRLVAGDHAWQQNNLLNTRGALNSLGKRIDQLLPRFQIFFVVPTPVNNGGAAELKYGQPDGVRDIDFSVEDTLNIRFADRSLFEVEQGFRDGMICTGF